jgi:transcriptional regulator with XRE-family HTH domain
VDIETMDAVAADLVRAVRGKRSQAEFSRRMGYRSNIVQRWESARCWPTAAAFLRACARFRPRTAGCFSQFFQRTPAWFEPQDPFTPRSIAAFLRDLRGKTPIGTLAQRMGRNRYSVGRWLSGTAQPKLPEFLALVEVSSRRALDFIAGIADPARMATVAPRWAQLESARQAAYDFPWSHAVLRALELKGHQRSTPIGEQRIARTLGIEVAEVRKGLEILAATGQIRRVRGHWQIDRVMTVDTSHDPARSQELKFAWIRVAMERLQAGAAGNYGYSLFAVSRRDLRRLRELHLEYLRAMQSLIAASRPCECVGLYCAQLLDLGADDGALGASGAPHGAG